MADYLERGASSAALKVVKGHAWMRLSKGRLGLATGGWGSSYLMLLAVTAKAREAAQKAR